MGVEIIMKRGTTINKKKIRKWKTIKRAKKNSTKNLKNLDYLKEDYTEKDLDKMSSGFQIYSMTKNKDDMNPQFEITGDFSSDNVKQTLLEHFDQVDDYFEKIKMAGYNKSNVVEVAFAISLKSKRASRNWTRVQNNLARTLRSIINNTDQNFRIIIAGHEKPNIKEMNHQRVTWLPVRFPPPTFISQYSIDKFRKRRVIGAYLRKIGFSGYFMPLDADDWVHYRFVEYIRSHPITDAFVINTGCMANMKSKQIWVRERFYKACGSGALFYLRNSDFPRTPKKRDVMKSKFKWVIFAHAKVTNYLKNKNYKMVNYPLVTWVVVHGDNNTTMKRKIRSSISAERYQAISENLEDWFYEYFKIK
jgi:hypothetical protein